MEKFKIDIYHHQEDISFEPKNLENAFSGTFETSIGVENILEELHCGDGIAINMIRPQDEIPLIRLEYLKGQNGQGTIDWLKKNNLLVSEDKDDFENYSDYNTILSIGEIELGEIESQELISFINSEFSSILITQTKNINIYEWGASGYFVDYIIGLAVGLSQSALEKIVEYLKDKGYGHAKITQFNIEKIMEFISKTYKINPNLLKLTSTRTLENQHTRFTFSSRFADYMIEIDKNNKVVISNVKNLTQTGI